MLPAGATRRRRELVATLYLRGFSEREIARQIRDSNTVDSPGAIVGLAKTTHITVHNDIVNLRKKLDEESTERIENARSEGVARLRMIQRQAWVDLNGSPRNVRPQYLRVIVDIEEKIAKLEGSYAPTKVAATDPDGVPVRSFIMMLPDGVEVRLPENSGNGHKEGELDGANTG